jgi:hypothetical protein
MICESKDSGFRLTTDAKQPIRCVVVLFPPGLASGAARLHIGFVPSLEK